MSRIPSEGAFDSTLAMLSEGYRYISNRCDRYGTDVFETRLLLQRTLCLRGEEAAALFYDGERFVRSGAAPGPLKKTLFGEGGVQALDGDRHHARKALFLSVLNRGAVSRLKALFLEEWERALPEWERRPQIVLFEEVERLLGRAVCSWAGIPGDRAFIDARTRELVALIEGAGGGGRRHLRARLARARLEHWLGSLVKQVRSGAMTIPRERALWKVAQFREPSGKLLSPRVAAVELLNLLRPTVAVARFVVFGAVALHEHPDARRSLLDGGEEEQTHFVQEVRRFYPFFPSVVALARRSFVWRGYRFPRGRRVLLDLYGTNHDRRLWVRPDEFRPERFRGWVGSPFSFVPQGGGDVDIGHRCAGEWLTVELMKVALTQLTQRMRYDVPPQDLHIPLHRIPAAPVSRFVMARIRAITADQTASPPSLFAPSYSQGSASL